MIEAPEASPAPPAVPLDEQIACLARELAMRRNVYRKWVAGGRMKQEAADKEISGMEAVLATLKGVHDEQNAKVAARG